MMCGVRKISKFVLRFFSELDRKKLPITGMSERNGTRDWSFVTASKIKPPITTVCASFTTTLVDADRMVVVGPSLGSLEMTSDTS